MGDSPDCCDGVRATAVVIDVWLARLCHKRGTSTSGARGSFLGAIALLHADTRRAQLEPSLTGADMPDGINEFSLAAADRRSACTNEQTQTSAARLAT
jgi:hypothetical protein